MMRSQSLFSFPAPPALIAGVCSAVALAFTTFECTAEEQGASQEKAAACFYTGDSPAPGAKVEYEGQVFVFSNEALQKRFEEERAASLYQKIGGKAALDAAVDLFYVKVLADERVNFMFDDVNMRVQHARQKEFLATALGAPYPWTGKDMRRAHADLDLRESDFDAIAELLTATLEELELDPGLIEEVMAIVATTRDDVLNR